MNLLTDVHSFVEKRVFSLSHEERGLPSPSGEGLGMRVRNISY